MAVALGMPPEALLACDDELLEHLMGLAERERTMHLWHAEVTAVTAELLHALWRLTYQANAKKGAHIPDPLRVPRPWADQPKARKRVTLAELTNRMLGRG